MSLSPSSRDVPDAQRQRGAVRGRRRLWLERWLAGTATLRCKAPLRSRLRFHHEEYSTKHGAATDALDRKLAGMLTNLSCGHDQKHEETRTSRSWSARLQGCVGEEPGDPVGARGSRPQGVFRCSWTGRRDGERASFRVDERPEPAPFGNPETTGAHRVFQGTPGGQGDERATE